MKKRIILPFLFLLAAIISLWYAYLLGEVSIGLILFFPMITAHGLYGLIGVLFLIVSFLLVFILYPKILFQSNSNQFNDEINKLNNNNASKKEMHTGGIIFIGPIPIVFGSNKKITRYLIISSLIILIIILVYASLLLNE